MLYHLLFRCSPKHLDFLSSLLDPFLLSTSSYEITESLWEFEGITDRFPNEKDVQSYLSKVASENNIKITDISVSPIQEENWLEKVYEHFPPQQIGRFFVYGSHYQGNIPDQTIPLQIDAATAFGSGEHETTKGCLLAIDRLLKRFSFKEVMDLGCGSGILAIAIAKLSGKKVLACDCDEEAVRVTQHHAKLNNCEELIHAFQGDTLSQNLPLFDLIVANILAGTLCEMVEGITKRVRSKGMVILSGILSRQAKKVIKIYGDHGFKVYQNRRIGSWSTIVLRKTA